MALEERRVARGVFYLFLFAVAVLLVRYARSIDWGEVAAALRGYDRTTVLLAATFYFGFIAMAVMRAQ